MCGTRRARNDLASRSFETGIALARTTVLGHAPNRAPSGAAIVGTRHLVGAIRTLETQSTVATTVILRNRPSAAASIQTCRRARDGVGTGLVCPPFGALTRTIIISNRVSPLAAIHTFQRTFLLRFTRLPGETQATSRGGRTSKEAERMSS